MIKRWTDERKHWCCPFIKPYAILLKFQYIVEECEIKDTNWLMTEYNDNGRYFYSRILKCDHHNINQNKKYKFTSKWRRSCSWLLLFNFRSFGISILLRCCFLSSDIDCCCCCCVFPLWWWWFFWWLWLLWCCCEFRWWCDIDIGSRSLVKSKSGGALQDDGARFG